MKNTILLIGTILLCVSCSRYFVIVEQHNPYKLKRKLNLHQQKDKERIQKISECKNSWNYLKLNDTVDIQVIQYYPAYTHSLSNISAMIIGVVDNDTIRVLSYEYYETLKKGQIVKVYPDTSSNKILSGNDKYLEITLLKKNTPTHLAKRKKDDALYCVVKKTYFGLLKK